MLGGTQSPRRKRKRKQKQEGMRRKTGEHQWYGYLFSTTNKDLGGLDLMFNWQLKVSKNSSRVQKIGITVYLLPQPRLNAGYTSPAK